MSNRRRTTITALAAGAVLAGAGFAIGSQSGGGNADARDGATGTAAARDAHCGGRGGPGGPGGPMFGSLADGLGVSEARLREALEALRPAGDRRDQLAASLAKALGVDEARVKEALSGLHDARRDEHADAVAKALGIETAKVRAALEKLKPEDRRGDRRGPRGMRLELGALADELGVSRARLRAALREAGPRGGHHHGGPGRHGRGGPGGDRAEALADALGVEAAQVEDALEAFHDQRREQFAERLAGELRVDVEKVREALPEPPRRP